MLYACGGAGINISKYFDSTRNQEEPGMAVIDIGYIDTSNSNLSSLDEDSVYLIQNKNGSGKVRGQNYPEINECVPDILQKFKPRDLNIVISSASGGSGSVLGPVLVSNLLERGKAVIVIMVGGADSLIELKNTIKTIQSYESIAKTRGVPVVAMYCENSETTPRRTVDADVRATVGVISAFFSGENQELDYADLFNWLNYQKVTSFTPKLVSLDFFEEKISITKSSGVSIISVATLAKEGANTSVEFPIEYQCVGYVGESVAKSMTLKSCTHAVVFDGVIEQIFVRLSKLLSERDESINARVVKSAILGNKHTPTDSGIVL